MSSVDAVSGSGSTSTNTSAPKVDNPGALLDRDAFLKLLVAQLKYQDPTKPTDTSQMLAQSAQLTMVDRLNELAEAVATSNTTQQMSLAGTIVGRAISFVGADGGIVTQTVTSARLSPDGLMLVTADYEIPYDAVAEVSDPPAATETPASTTTGTAGTASDTTSDTTSGTATTTDAGTSTADTTAGTTADTTADTSTDTNNSPAATDAAEPTSGDGTATSTT